MRKLLFADSFRIFRSKWFWLCLGGMLALAGAFVTMQYTAMDHTVPLSRVIFLPMSFYGMAVAALVTLFFFILLRFDDNTFAKFSYEVNEDGVSATVSGFDGSNGSIDIPEEIDGYKVVAISDHAFANKEKLKKVSIPDSVEVIGKYAFDNCTSLKEVKIGKNVREIGHYAFYGCKMLKSADLPEKLESVGDFAFCSCIRLEKIKIPASCTVIGSTPRCRAALIAASVLSTVYRPGTGQRTRKTTLSA